MARVAGGRDATGGRVPLVPRHPCPSQVDLEGGEEVAPVDLGGGRR